MKPISVSGVITFVISLLSSFIIQAQIGISSSATWITDCNQSNYFNTTGSIGPAGNVFANNNFGTHTQNSGTLILRGGEVRSFKTPGSSNVCAARMYYRVYPQSSVPGSFNSIDLSFIDDCIVPPGNFASGGSCAASDQKWNRVIADGTTTPYAPVDLTTYAAGNYVLDVYYEITGSSTTTSQCNETVVLNNGGSYYKASFSIQQPVVLSANPVTCNGSEGSVTINGLTPGGNYTVSYTDDGNPVGPLALVANGAGEIIITGLNAGIYADFILTINGCTTELNTGRILSNPVIVPRFTRINPFCAGTTPPTLPTTSLNGITGTWTPSVINNQSSGPYIFTPAGGQCGIPITINVVVIPNTVPTFSFGTSQTICAGGSVPILPNTSTNGVNGTWSPSVVDNQNSGTYTFTPSAGQCATGTTFTLTVTPNITPAFSFGTSLTVCAGSSVPSLPTTSDNGITGTWSPSVVDNQNSGTYTFTPTAGQCGLPTSLNVTVNPNTTPVFSFGTSLSICAGASVPSLPATSNNGVTGTWSPSLIDNQTSGVYTFTPTAGLCALPFTLTVTVAPNIVPAFSFGTSSSICAGSPVPSLPNTSTNGITGTWSPSIVSNTVSGTYTFTPDAGQCATQASFSVTVNPVVTPTFENNFYSICAGSTAPTLPTTSLEGLTGSWSPATVSNINSATYTFIPDAGQCAVSSTIDVDVIPMVTPTFSIGTSLTICSGQAVPVLPSMSDEGFTGTWSPAVVSNTSSGTYTFTPDAGQCANTTTFTVNVNPTITPSFGFGPSLSICNGGTVPALPTSSVNGITGSWNPAIVDNQNSGTYTFTPDAGQCALPFNFTVTVNAIVTPAFGFGTSLAVCAGAGVPVLPNTSTNGISGTWNPAAIDNQNSGAYTFTPDAGQCANPATLTVTVNSNITPVFSFGTTLIICAGESVPALPTTSDNGIIGTWNAAAVSNQNSAAYTFTPSAGQCATTATFNVTVNPNITPAFSFGTSLSICAGVTVPSLSNTSSNGITGTWSPNVVDNQNSATYTFTPDVGQCAVPATFTVTVSPNVTPIFSFGNSLSICAGNTAPVLSTTSSNGITGTWNPATVNNQASGVYTFTPSAGQCATTATFIVTVTQNTIPAFSFGTSLVICSGDAVPALPPTSLNGVTGTWSPATVNNQTSAVYTFTPDVMPGQCINSVNFIVTVNQRVVPAFSFGTSVNLCTGAAVPILPTTSTNGITGTWSPATVSNQTSGTYTFTPDAGQCVQSGTTLSVNVTPVATVNFIADTTINDGTFLPGETLTGTPQGVSFTWTNSNTAIGLPASGAGNIPSFTATNKGSSQITATIVVTPVINGCAGTARNYSIKVNPLDKDVFVPNVFTPNGDGKNDMLYAYSNYITKLEMRIFNQWGQLVHTINDVTKGWDGKYKGSAQPVGVYVFTLKATMTDGRTVEKKGSITLLR